MDAPCPNAKQTNAVELVAYPSMKRKAVRKEARKRVSREQGCVKEEERDEDKTGGREGGCDEMLRDELLNLVKTRGRKKTC